MVEPATRTLRLLHSTVDSAERVKQLIERLQSGQPLDDAGFGPVVDVEFPENSAQITSSVTALRLAWQAAPRPPSLGMLVAAGGGDGPTVALARIDAVRSALTGLVETQGGGDCFFCRRYRRSSRAGHRRRAAQRRCAGDRAAGVRPVAGLSGADMAQLVKVLRALKSDPGLPLEELMGRRGSRSTR